MAMPTVPLNTPSAHLSGDAALLEARASWTPELSAEDGLPLLDAMARTEAKTLGGLLAQAEALCWALDVDTNPEPELSQRLASKMRAALQRLALDPHPALEAQCLAIEDWCNSPACRGLPDEEFNALLAPCLRLRRRILETPALTVAGLAAQVRMVVRTYDVDASEIGEREVAALRLVATQLEQLAGRA